MALVVRNALLREQAARSSDQWHNYCHVKGQRQTYCCDGQEAITELSRDGAFTLSAMLLPARDKSRAWSLTFNTKGANEMQTIKNFLKDESGMETLEYALIAGLIAAVAVVVYVGWGNTLKNRLLNATTTS